MNNHKHKIVTCVFAFFLCIVSVVCWFKPDDAFSESERRELTKMPELSVETVASGEFMNSFEEYTTDQFPARDMLRGVKALFSKYVFNKLDNNGLYYSYGHLSKLEYPVNPDMVNNAKKRFDYLYNTYMKDKNVNIYLSLIPDKNYYLSQKNGYISIDYKAFMDDFKSMMDYMKYIDISDKLSLDDYYRTDSHWKQEEIVDVAKYIAENMGTPIIEDYDVKKLDGPFKGVYLGQSALNVEPDEIKYLTNENLLNCKVNYFDTGMPKAGEIYNMEKANGKDPYEMFLSGTSPLIEIENPDSLTDKELVIFRDSYGSSISPLFCSGYKKVTIVDIRYIQSAFLGNFVKFDNQDVLFLYSTTIINNSMSLR
ncbi:MAG: hypothetical protein E7396_01260 [Ruminococcaceae bacterium]|nr:hypothetical protein [Oscillospiraceae bacterium]